MDDQDEFETDSPATRLLDALGRGDLNALLVEFRPTTIVRTEDRTWSVQGEDEVLFWLEDAFERFPGLVFDSHARHIGYGQVIEEARVRDIGAPSPVSEPASDGSPEEGDGHQSATAHGSAPGSGALVLDRDFGKTEGPQLNMPVRLTVLHDDAYVHEIIASYPRALLRAALGLHVDPLDMAVSEIQSAFVASAGSGFKTYQMGKKRNVETEFAAPLPVATARVVEPESESGPEPVEPVDLQEALKSTWTPPPLIPDDADRHDGSDGTDDGRDDDRDDEDERGGRRRALLVVPLVVLLVGAIAGGTWWLGRDDNTPTAEPPRSTESSKDVKPTKKPANKPSEKPDVTFQSDLAFAINSAELSAGAKANIVDLAAQIRRAELTGTIEVHGYTDNVGSAAYAEVLSLERANAVKNYLRASLDGYRIPIEAYGHGENDPVASNATEAGRAKNRRVELTLPDN